MSNAIEHYWLDPPVLSKLLYCSGVNDLQIGSGVNIDQRPISRHLIHNIKSCGMLCEQQPRSGEDSTKQPSAQLPATYVPLPHVKRRPHLIVHSTNDQSCRWAWFGRWQRDNLQLGRKRNVSIPAWGMGLNPEDGS